MGRYRLSKAAQQDIERPYLFGIESFGVEQADRYFEGLFERLDELASQPMLYPAVDNIRQGYRRSVYGAHSIYYRIDGNDVNVIRILGRENPSVLG